MVNPSACAKDHLSITFIKVIILISVAMDANLTLDFGFLK